MAGLTQSATREQTGQTMTDMDLQQRIARAQNANVKLTTGQKIRRWIEKQSPVAVFFAALQLVALIAFTLFEAHNSGRGWIMITNGAAPWFLAYSLGVGMTIGYLSFHRKAAEELRAGRKDKGGQAAIVAVICTALALFGVFSNVASKTSVSASAATENNTDRAILLAEIRQLEAEVTPESVAQTEALADVTRRQIGSKEAEAIGWGLKAGATIEECANDLRPRQRQLCNTLNGSDNSMGLRNELTLHESALDGYRSKSERLEAMRAEVKGMKVEEGAAHWDAMSKITSGAASPDMFRIWGTFLASLGILFILGFGWDSFLEKREEETEEIEANG